MQRYCKILNWRDFYTKIIGRDIKKITTGIFYKTKEKAEIFQKSQEVEFINQKYR